MSSPDAARTLRIIYDGECPFCSNFVRLYQIRDNVGAVELVDARAEPDLVASLRRDGLEINEGMVALWDGRTYHGGAAMNLLSMLSVRTGVFAMINRLLFANPRLAKAVYPALVVGRGATLAIMGRKLIPT